jgi:hypothetical protein
MKPATVPTVGYVFAVPAGDLVGIYATFNLAQDLNAVRKAVPSAGVGYILATAAPKMVAALAEGKLKDKAAGGGWYVATLDETQAAIDDAAAQYTGLKIIHTTSDAVIATAGRR